MTSYKMFPLTLKPNMKIKTTQLVYQEKYAWYDTPFKEES
jgi:hypothetical protein